MDKLEPSDSTPKNEFPEQRELENISSRQQGKNQTNRTRDKQREKLSHPVIAAWIALIGVIFAALLASPIIQCWIQPYTCEPPPPTFPSPLPPTFTILNALGVDAKPIDKNYAPYDVLVSGNVTNAMGYYLYLIVDDGHQRWIQNPVGIIPDNNFNFSGHCFLGAGADDPVAQNSTYIIYAVISDNGSYLEYGDFTGQTAKATSESISLVRRDPVIPMP